MNISLNKNMLQKFKLIITYSKLNLTFVPVLLHHPLSKKLSKVYYTFKDFLKIFVKVVVLFCHHGSVSVNLRYIRAKF